MNSVWETETYFRTMVFWLGRKTVLPKMKNALHFQNHNTFIHTLYITIQCIISNDHTHMPVSQLNNLLCKDILKKVVN